MKSQAVNDYLAAFDLVALTADGKPTHDPRRVAWWCARADAERLVERARRDGGDVAAAARKLGVAVADHATVLARAEAAVRRINNGVEWARRTGVLAELNAEYKRRRLLAEQRGETFMRYGEMQAKLGRVLAAQVAGSSTTGTLVSQVFDRTR